MRKFSAVLGEEHALTAICRDGLANVYMCQGNYDKAKEILSYYIKAYKIL